MDQLTILVTLAPVISGADATLADVEVLGVVDVLVGARMDTVYNTGLKVDQNGARDVAGVVALIVEDVFAVAALGREVLQIPVLVDPVLLAELLPELAANCVVLCQTGPGKFATKDTWDMRLGTHCCCRTGQPGS